MSRSRRAAQPWLRLSVCAALMLCACGSGGGGSKPPVTTCTEVEARPLGVVGVDDSSGMLSVFDLRADAQGPFFLLQTITGGVADQAITEIVARLDAAPTTVYAQGDTVPEGMGLFNDGAGRACALVGTSSTSYTHCLDAAEQPTGLSAIATSTSDFLTPSSRIVSSVQSDGATIFFSYGPFAALYGLQLLGGAFSTFELFESSISFPGASATAGGFAYACFVGSDDGLGVAGPGAVVARTHDGSTYRDCRMASDGTRLYVVGLTDAGGRYVSFQPSITGGGAVSDLVTVPLAIDSDGSFALVFFAGKPGLVQFYINGTVSLSPIAADGALESPRTLATGAEFLAAPMAVGPDGGLHLEVSIAGRLAYVKRCP